MLCLKTSNYCNQSHNNYVNYKFNYDLYNCPPIIGATSRELLGWKVETHMTFENRPYSVAVCGHVNKQLINRKACLVQL